MTNQVFIPATKTSGLFQTIPSLTGDQKLVVNSVTNKIIFSNLTTIGGADNQIEFVYDFAKSYADNLSVFKSKLVDSNRDFYYDQLIIDDQNIKLLDSTEYASYSSQWYNRYQWGVHMIDNNRKLYRFFAPLWLTNTDPIPTYFVILRKPKTLNLTSQPTSISDIIKTGELVKCIELKSSGLDRVLNQVISDSEFTNTPIAYSNDRITTYGINVDTGKYENVQTFTDNEKWYDDNTITLDNELLTSLFKTNNQVCSNIVNIDFEFEVPTIDDTVINEFDYIGMYCSDELITELVDFNLAKLTTTIHFDQNILSIAKLYSGSYKRTNELTETDFSGILTSVQMSSNTYNPAIIDITRQIRIKFNGLPLIGDEFRIITDFHNIEFYASNQNTINQFKVESTIQETIQNLVTQIKNRLDYIDTYDFEFHISDTELTIDSNMYFDDALLQCQLLSLTVSNVLDVNGNFSGGLIDFPSSVQTQNSIFVKNWRTLPSLTINSTNLFSSKLVDLIHSDGSSTSLNILSISEIDSNLYIKFSASIFTDSDLSKPIILFKLKKYSIAKLLRFYPILHFDKTLNNPSESRVYDFDIAKWHAELALLQATGYGTATTGDITTLSNEFLNLVFDGLYIKSLNLENSETTNNPYERLAESDLVDHAFINKRSNKLLKWSNASGMLATGFPCIANRNIAFSIDSGFASHESFYDSYQNLDLSWFVIGTQPRDYAKLVYDFLKSYTTELVNDTYNFINTNVDKFTELLQHKFSLNSNGYNCVEAFSIIQSKSTNILSDTNGFAVFRGVEYLFNSRLVGYKFAVVYMQYATTDVQAEFIVNDTFKTCTLLIKYAIADVMTTNLNDSTLNKYNIDRVIFYNQSELDQGLTTTVTSKVYVKFNYPNLSDDLVYAATPYSTGIIDTGSFLLYCIRFENAPEDWLSGITVGSDITVYTVSEYGTVHKIDIQTIEEVNVTEQYIWARTIIVTDLTNAPVVLYNTDTDLPDLSTAQSDGPALFTSSGIQEQYYYINYSVIANNGENRFEPLKLKNCIDIINDCTDLMQISEKDTIPSISKYSAEQDGLSKVLTENDTKIAITLLRNAILATPLCQYLYWPKTYTRTIGSVDYVLQNCGISDEFSIPEYVIRKIGSNSTLATDNRSDELPQHWQIGETVLALVENKTYWSIDTQDNIRIYIDRNSNNQLSSSRFLTNYTGLISTILDINQIRFDTTISIDNGNYYFNVYTKLSEYISSLVPFSSLSKLELNVFLFTILDTYSYSAEIYDTNGQIFIPEIQDAASYNKSTTIDKYILSGYVSSNAASLTCTITIK